MLIRRILLDITTVRLLALPPATPAQAIQDLVGGKSINKLTVPFSRTVSAATGNINVPGNVAVKDIHFPHTSWKAISTAYNVANRPFRYPASAPNAQQPKLTGDCFG